MKKVLLFAFLFVLIASFVKSNMVAHAATQGTTIKVTTTKDELNNDGDCSLREAMRAANLDKRVDGCPAGNGKDTVKIPSGVYRLTRTPQPSNDVETGSLNVYSDVVVQGEGMYETIIDGNKTDRVFELFGYSWETPYKIVLKAMTIRNGLAKDGFGGGGVKNSHAQVKIERVFITKNKTVQGSGGNYGGGGIRNTGDMRLVDVWLTENSAPQPTQGAGNDGAAIVNSSCTPNCRMTLERVTVSNNEPGTPAITNRYLMSITNSTISNNGGAGIESLPAVSDLVLTNVTIVGNGDSGLTYQYNAKLKNVTLADNVNGNCKQDYSGIISLGYNLSDDSTCSSQLTAEGDLNETDPLLGALGLHGGLTPTHIPQSDSPVIDTGTNEGCPTQDQRGILRPQDGNNDADAKCDRGAVEFTGMAIPSQPTLVAPADQSNIKKIRALLSWTASATYSQVNLYETDALGPIILSATPIDSQIKTPTLKRGNSYVWAVRACNDWGCSDWTSYRKFTIIQ